jgi:hypothetical protein
MFGDSFNSLSNRLFPLPDQNRRAVVAHPHRPAGPCGVSTGVGRAAAGVGRERRRLAATPAGVSRTTRVCAAPLALFAVGLEVANRSVSTAPRHHPPRRIAPTSTIRPDHPRSVPSSFRRRRWGEAGECPRVDACPMEHESTLPSGAGAIASRAGVSFFSDRVSPGKRLSRRRGDWHGREADGPAMKRCGSKSPSPNPPVVLLMPAPARSARSMEGRSAMEHLNSREKILPIACAARSMAPRRCGAS